MRLAFLLKGVVVKKQNGFGSTKKMLGNTAHAPKLERRRLEQGRYNATDIQQDNRGAGFDSAARRVLEMEVILKRPWVPRMGPTGP